MGSGTLHKNSLSKHSSCANVCVLLEFIYAVIFLDEGFTRNGCLK